MNTTTHSSRSRLCLKLIQSHPVKFSALFAAIVVPLGLSSVTQGHQQNSTRLTTHNRHTLTVVTVQSPTTVFHKDGFTYGFAYDLAKDYARSLNLQLELKTVADNATALKWVKQGKAQIALTTAKTAAIEKYQLTAIEGSCGAQNILQKNGLNRDISWVFASADDPLTVSASGFLCQSKQNGSLQQLASFYDRNYIKPQELQLATRDIQARLPIYKASFKQSANQHDLDWQFLVAIAYQESYLNPRSVSPTGVRGVMMLTQNTAKAMGVTDRTNARQSIQGGAKYFNYLLTKYQDIPNPDRHWYALIAYNMGPNAVNQIRQQLKRQGKNPDRWVNMYQYLQKHRSSNARYGQALQYVKRIRIFLEHIKTSSLAKI